MRIKIIIRALTDPLHDHSFMHAAISTEYRTTDQSKVLHARPSSHLSLQADATSSKS